MKQCFYNFEQKWFSSANSVLSQTRVQLCWEYKLVLDIKKTDNFAPTNPLGKKLPKDYYSKERHQYNIRQLRHKISDMQINE